jgi:hypothetical protein
MKTLLSAAVITALSVNTCFGITHTISGLMDVQQAGTNGGFGAGTGNGTGTILGDYDANTNTINYTLTWQDLVTSVTNMHFHVGAPGVSGGVELGVPGPWSSPYVGSGNVDIQAKEDNLLAGNWYLNIHTDGSAGGFPGGEIRGQVIVAAIPEPASLLLLSVGFISLIVRRRS